MALCCPVYCCCAVFAGILPLQIISMLSMFPSMNQYVVEVDCSRNSDAFGGHVIPRDALHHLTNCDVTEIKDSANGAYFVVGSFRIDAKHEPDYDDGTQLVPGQPISFLGNLSTGTLDEWNYDRYGSYIFLASNNSVSAAKMIGLESNRDFIGSSILGVLVAFSLVGSASFVFFPNGPRVSFPCFRPPALGVAAVTWLASVLTAFLVYTMGWAGLFVGAAAVFACLFVDNLDDRLCKLKDDLLSLKARFTSSHLEERLLPTHAAPSPALLEVAVPEATAEIQPNQIERRTSVIAFMLLGMVAGLGGGVVLLLGLSMLGFH